MPNVYQVRGFVLANTSFAKGDRDWTIFDPFTFEVTARAALESVKRNLDKFPVKAFLYSLSHSDHWRSARGGDVEADDRTGKLAIIAPGNCPRDRRSVLHAACQTVSRCISRYMNDGQEWIC